MTAIGDSMRAAMPRSSRLAIFALAALASTALSAPAQASVLAAVVPLSSLNISTGVRLDGVAASDISGRSVANAGDANGDGFADVIIGAYFADPNALSAAGSSYVVFGKGPGSGGFASAVKRRAFHCLGYFSRVVGDANRDLKIPFVLSGDLLHYSRHIAADDGTQFMSDRSHSEGYAGQRRGGAQVSTSGASRVAT